MRNLLMVFLVLLMAGCNNESVDVEYNGDIGWLTIRDDSGEHRVEERLSAPTRLKILSTDAYEASSGNVVAFRIHFSLPVEHQGVGYSHEQWLAEITQTEAREWRYNRTEEKYYYESSVFNEYAEVHALDVSYYDNQENLVFVMKYATPRAYKNIL